MTHVGYARLTAQDRDHAAQVNRLEEAGCQKVYQDKVADTKAPRPEWERCFNSLQRGDVLIVTHLSGVFRSSKHLAGIAQDLSQRGVALRVLDQGIDTTSAEGWSFFGLIAVIADFERSLIVEQINDGLAASRAQGRKGGRRPVLDAKQLARAQELYDAGDHTVADIAQVVGVSQSTLYRHLATKANSAKSEAT